MNNFKKYAILESLKHVKENMILCIGNENIMLYFIEILKDHEIKNKLNLVVYSSLNIKNELDKYKIKSVKLDLIDHIDIYIDSADEIDNNMYMIKGKKGFLTKEKIASHMSNKFICIINDNKNVEYLGLKIPLPIEIIPESINYVTKKLLEINGRCILRKNFLTDNNSLILDVYDINIDDPKFLEMYLNTIPGIIENGIFSHRTPDLLISFSKNNISFKNI